MKSLRVRVRGKKWAQGAEVDANGKSGRERGGIEVRRKGTGEHKRKGWRWGKACGVGGQPEGVVRG